MTNTFTSFIVATLAIGTLAYAGEPNKQGDGSAEKAKLSADELHAAVQQICPVTGQKLGDHGKPVKVRIGKEELFLCCKACASKKVDPKHWATIHANIAKAQGICPVMKNALPEKAKWTIVKGRLIYVCCPPCIEKIEADPDTYLAALDKLYSKSLEKKENKE